MRQQGPQRGADLRFDLDISFEEAAFGTEKEIPIERRDTCGRCGGSGAEPGTSVDTCPRCNGTGIEQVVQNTPFGQFASSRTCQQCQGRGKNIKTPCKECRGTGETSVRKKLQVKIPAGVDSGSRLRVGGEGEPGTLGGPRGDLYVYIYVHSHPEFKRNGNDVISEKEITFAQAALGATIKVNTLDGAAELKIPAGTQTGTAFRLRDKGIPYLRDSSRRGSQHVIVTVKTPTKLNAKQKEYLAAFAKEGKEDVDCLGLEKGFFDKLKDLFTD